MNPKFRDLQIQAFAECKTFEDGQFRTDEVFERFAELIIRECVSTLNDMHMWQSVNNQNYPNSWHDAVDQGIDAIKSHFGVEE